MNDLKVLAVITARGGSKGIPRKNIKDLAGKPLIAWTIEAAKGSVLLNDFLVSTDDQEIADISRQFGAPVPFLRPPELATDTATSMAVVQHALVWMKENEGKTYDALMILQPTSPLRTSEDIDGCIEKMRQTDCDSVMAMYRLSDLSLKKLKILDEDKILPVVEDEGPQTTMRQLAKPLYKRNGCAYLTKVGFIDQGDLFGKDSRAYIMSEDRSADINTPLDFEIADFLMRRKLNK